MHIPSLKEVVSAEEWALRCELAACYRLVAKYGMTDLIYNHITARVPGPEHHILISGYGMLYEEVTASSLIKVDLAGRVFVAVALGVWVFEPDGRLLGILATPKRPSNLAWCDPDGRGLVITAVDGVYYTRLKTPGLSPPFLPTD